MLTRVGKMAARWRDCSLGLKGQDLVSSVLRDGTATAAEEGGATTVVPGGDKEPAKRPGVSSETVSSETEAVHQGGSFRGRALDKKPCTGVSNETVSSETEAARGRALDNLPCKFVSSETEATREGGSPRGRALDKKPDNEPGVSN